MGVVVVIVGLAVAHYLAKLGKTQGQSVAIWFAIIGVVVLLNWLGWW